MGSTSSEDNINPTKKESESATFGASPDVTFIFPNNGGATVCVERYKLMNASEVFKKQFSSSHSDEEEPVRIAITDITIDVFKEVMSFIYDDEIVDTACEENFVIDEENYLELLYVSRKYFLNGLTFDVICFAIKYINERNVQEIFEFIEKFDIKMVNDHMRKICIRSPLKVIGSLSTSEPHKRMLKMILEASSLPCTEYALFEAIKRMFQANNDEKVFDNEIFRKELGNLIYLIRFPAMTITELIGCAIKPSPLTAEELRDLLLWSQEDIFSNTIQFFSRESRLIQDDTPKYCKRCRSFDEVCQKCKNKY